MAGRYPLDPRVQRPEQPEAFGFGCTQRSSGGGPNPLSEFGAQAGDISRQVMDVPAQHNLRAGPAVVAQGLTEGLIRSKHLLVPPPIQHEAPVGVYQPGQFGRECCLAHSRLPGHQRQDTVTGQCPRPCLLQCAEFRLPADESSARGGLDPDEVRGTCLVIAVACAGRFTVWRRREGPQSLAALGGQHVLCRCPPPGRCHEQLVHQPGQLQRASQQEGSVLAGGPVDTPLQVAY
jgi:hypothetical protein